MCDCKDCCRPDDYVQERDVAYREIGDYLVIWRANVEDYTGAIESEWYETATRKDRERRWENWNPHDTLRDAIEDAMSNNSGCLPDPTDVWKIEASMLKSAIIKMEGKSL